MRNILITGINGFVGLNIYNSLKSDYKLYGIGHGKKRDKFKTLIKYTNKSIRKNILQKYFANIDTIIHCAGSGLVGLSDNQKIFLRDVNSTKNILKFASDNKKKINVIFISSISVYGNEYKKKISEKTEILPISNYAKSKKESEKICKKYSDKFNIGVKILRVTSLYGMGLKKQVIFDAIIKILRNENKFHGTGNEIRDFLHIDDFTDLIKKILKKKFENYEILNCGSGKEYKIKDVIQKVKKKNNFKKKIIFTKKYIKSNPKYMVANISKVKKNYKWKPKKNFYVELPKLINQIKKNYD